MILGPTLVRKKALVLTLVPGCVTLDASPRVSELWNGTAPPMERDRRLCRRGQASAGGCQETARLLPVCRAQFWEPQRHWRGCPASPWQRALRPGPSGR